MNTQRNKSKSKKFWKYGSETREQRRARLNASKSNAKRRARKIRYVKPKETPELKAERAAGIKAAALKLFTKWLEKPEVNNLAMKDTYYTLLERLKYNLADCLSAEEWGS
jgi:hypothetical protein